MDASFVKKKKSGGVKYTLHQIPTPPPQHDRSKGMFGMRETTWGCDSSGGKGHQCAVSHYISDCQVIMPASHSGVCGRQSTKSHSNPETRHMPSGVGGNGADKRLRCVTSQFETQRAIDHKTTRKGHWESTGQRDKRTWMRSSTSCRKHVLSVMCTKYDIKMGFNFFNQRMHLFVSVQFTPHMFRPWLGHHQRYVDKFTSLFTAPFGIITTITLFKAIIYIGNHQYTQFLQVASWNVLVYSTINCEYRALCRECQNY
jgi:hypothetical protein